MYTYDTLSREVLVNYTDIQNGALFKTKDLS